MDRRTTPLIWASETTLTRHQMLQGAAGLAVGLMAEGLVKDSVAATAAQSRRPNIVVIYTDDHNFEHIGCYGADVHTPHQDRLASEGMCFNRGYTTTSVCTPSRYGCLTGRFPSRCQHPDFVEQFSDGVQLEPSFNTLLEPGAPNLARILRDAGYATGMVGKWHLGPRLGSGDESRDLMPFPRTDAWTAVPSEADPRDPQISQVLRHNHDRYREEIRAHGFDYAESIYWTNPEGWRSHAFNVHNMEWVVQGALDFIDQNRDGPFFLYMAPTLHHIPHPQESLLQADPRITVGGYLDQVPDVMPPRGEVLERVRSAGFASETAYCTWLDDGIGAVMDRLEELGLAEDTLVILFSDHQTHAKGTLYEGGVRTPCIMRWPRRAPAGRVSRALVQNIDLLPTILDASGVATPANMHVDGKSMLPVLAGLESAVHEQLFFEIGWTRAVCTDRWKYLALRYSDSARKLAEARDKRLYHNLALEPHQHNVLLEHPNFWDPDQLYDLSIDSTETTNLARTQAETLADMKARLTAWLETFGNHPFGEFVG